jgi:hypothetical protein
VGVLLVVVGHGLCIAPPLVQELGGAQRAPAAGVHVRKDGVLRSKTGGVCVCVWGGGVSHGTWFMSVRHQAIATLAELLQH